MFVKILLKLDDDLAQALYLQFIDKHVIKKNSDFAAIGHMVHNETIRNVLSF